MCLPVSPTTHALTARNTRVNGDPFSAHCISDHRISDQNVRTVMVRAIVRVRVRVWVRVRVRLGLGDAVVRKVGNPGE